MLEQVVAVPAHLDALPGLRVKRKEVVDNSPVIPGTVIGGLGVCLLCLSIALPWLANHILTRVPFLSLVYEA